jgi:hypothetical protein
MQIIGFKTWLRVGYWCCSSWYWNKTVKTQIAKVCITSHLYGILTAFKISFQIMRTVWEWTEMFWWCKNDKILLQWKIKLYGLNVTALMLGLCNGRAYGIIIKISGAQENTWTFSYLLYVSRQKRIPFHCILFYGTHDLCSIILKNATICA